MSGGNLNKVIIPLLVLLAVVLLGGIGLSIWWFLSDRWILGSLALIPPFGLIFFFWKMNRR